MVRNAQKSFEEYEFSIDCVKKCESFGATALSSFSNSLVQSAGSPGLGLLFLGKIMTILT